MDFLSDQPAIRECIGREAEFQRDAKTTTSSSCGVHHGVAGGGDGGVDGSGSAHSVYDSVRSIAE